MVGSFKFQLNPLSPCSVPRNKEQEEEGKQTHRFFELNTITPASCVAGGLKRRAEEQTPGQQFSTE